MRRIMFSNGAHETSIVPSNDHTSQKLIKSKNCKRFHINQSINQPTNKPIRKLPLTEK